MPDPLRKSVSATEASALFDVNPYQTRWMLYWKFAEGREVETPAHSRMDWGTILEPHVLEWAARDLKLEVRPNKGADGKQVYVRRGQLGCTRDAEIFCPDRGPGALETKCVFDYKTWMNEWSGGNKPPRHHEIQLQTQLYVGDGQTSYNWGVEAVWIAGEVIYFERKPVPKFIDALEQQTAKFFEDVANHNEPEPFGSPREWPLLDEVFPVDEEKVLDLRQGEQGLKLAELVRMYEYHRTQRLGHQKGEDVIRGKIRLLCRDHGKLLLPHGINVTMKQNKKSVGFKVYIPKDLPEGKFDGY